MKFLFSETKEFLNILKISKGGQNCKLSYYCININNNNNNKINNNNVIYDIN